MDTEINREQKQVMELVVSSWIGKLLFTAIHLGIPDMLSAGDLHIDTLAEKCGTDPDRISRMMKALASTGFFSEKRENSFSHSPLSRMITSPAMGPMVGMLLSPWHSAAWDMLPRALETGESGFRLARGKDAFTWLRDNPGEGEIYQQANGRKAAMISERLAVTCSFREGERLVDIGGGYGHLLIGLLKSDRTLRGVVADLPPVIQRAGEVIKSAGLDERCRTVECDFFREVPEGGDTYILSNILHDWEDEKAKIILENCRKVMTRGSRLLVLEMILPGDSRPSFSKLMDIEVMVMGNGRERNREEFRELLSGSGFKVESILPLDGDTFTIESGIV